MKRTDFYREGPQVTKIQHGKEPSIAYCIQQYYVLSGVKPEIAKVLVEDYISGWLKEAKK